VANNTSNVIKLLLLWNALTAASIGQVQKPSANQCPDGSNTVDGDLLLPIAQRWVEQTFREFEIVDRLEAELLCVDLLRKDFDPGNESITSIVLFRPAHTTRVSKMYEKKCENGETLRFNRMVTANVRAPVAIITTATSPKSRPVISEKVLYYDDKAKWREGWIKPNKKAGKEGTR
jgi:hypothetical protein